MLRGLAGLAGRRLVPRHGAAAWARVQPPAAVLGSLNDPVRFLGTDSSASMETAESTKPKRKKRTPKDPSKPKARSALVTRIHEFSPELQALTGVKEGSRTEAVQLFWKYVRDNNCKDEKQKGLIAGDAAVHKVVGHSRPIKNTEVFRVLANNIKGHVADYKEDGSVARR